MSLQHQRTRQQSREQQPQPKTAKKVTNSSNSSNMKLSSTRNSSATWSNSNHRERTPPIPIPQRLVFDSGYNSKDRQTPMLYYNFPKQIETPLHRQTPFKRRIMKWQEMSWQEESQRSSLPDYHKMMSDEDDIQKTVKDTGEPGPHFFDPRAATKPAKGAAIAVPTPSITDLCERRKLEYEELSKVSDGTSKSQITSSPSQMFSNRILLPETKTERKQKPYTGMMKSPLSLIAKQLGRSTSGPFYPGCIEHQAFEHRRRNPLLLAAYPNSPAPLPSHIENLTSPVLTGDRTGQTIGLKKQIPMTSTERKTDKQARDVPHQLALFGSLDAVLLNGQVLWDGKSGRDGARGEANERGQAKHGWTIVNHGQIWIDNE